MFTTFECRKMFLHRSFFSLTLSVCIQIVLLAIFLLCVNFYNPTETVRLMLSFYTWLSITPLIASIIIYGILLGKSYLTVKKYYSSRFKWILATGVRKISFLGAHILVGFLTSWLYSRFLHMDYRNFICNCYGTKCINSRYTFLACAGIAVSCYYFCKEHLRQEPDVEFPIVQEKIWIRIRSLLYLTVYKSLTKSFVPTLSFAFGYWLLGGLMNKRLALLFGVEVDDNLNSIFAIGVNLRLFFYTWILSAQILSNMHFMQRLFSIKLSEQTHFVIERNPVLQNSDNAEITLIDALGMQQVPIIQNLAAYDLYTISVSKIPPRRQEIFALSVPGNHPYNWNQLYGQCLALINAFTEELSASVKNISNVKTTPLYATIKPTATEDAEKILLRQYNETFGIRRMMSEPCPSSTQSPPTAQQKNVTNACQRINQQFEQISRQCEIALFSAFRTIPGLFYVFGEPDGARTAFILSNSQNIVWLTQGLAGICAASLVEDKYGVVQGALSAIIKAMLMLRMELDKLNNVNLNGKKLDRNLITLKNALKRSLYIICTVFGDYLRDVVDETQDWHKLQSFLSYQEI